jgi:outer membrane lipoprotein-sorting protein
MKTTILLSGILFLSISLMAQPTVDKKAKAVLDEVSALAKSYTSMSIDFTYTMENKGSNINESKQGTILIKGEKYQLNISGQTIICDGKTIWTFIKDANEVTITTPSTDEDAINPATIYTLWEKGYKYKYIKEEVQAGIAVHIIDLTPIKGKSYHKVRVVVDKNKKQLVSSTVYDKDNTTYAYKIKVFKTNTVIDDKKFTFNKASYPGVEIIDNR